MSVVCLSVINSTCGGLFPWRFKMKPKPGRKPSNGTENIWKKFEGRFCSFGVVLSSFFFVS